MYHPVINAGLALRKPQDFTAYGRPDGRPRCCCLQSPPAPLLNFLSVSNMPGMGINTYKSLNFQFQRQPSTPQEGPATPHSNHMPCLGTIGTNLLPHGVSVGLDFMSHLMMGLGPQEPQMVSQGEMSFLQDKSLPQQISFSYGGPSGGRATSWRHGVTSPQNSALCKHGGPRGPEAFIVLGTSMTLVFSDPHLQEVIPEVDTGKLRGYQETIRKQLIKEAEDVRLSKHPLSSQSSTISYSCIYVMLFERQAIMSLRHRSRMSLCGLNSKKRKIFLFHTCLQRNYNFSQLKTSIVKIKNKTHIEESLWPYSAGCKNHEPQKGFRKIMATSSEKVNNSKQGAVPFLNKTIQLLTKFHKIRKDFGLQVQVAESTLLQMKPKFNEMLTSTNEALNTYGGCKCPAAKSKLKENKKQNSEWLMADSSIEEASRSRQRYSLILEKRDEGMAASLFRAAILEDLRPDVLAATTSEYIKVTSNGKLISKRERAREGDKEKKRQKRRKRNISRDNMSTSIDFEDGRIRGDVNASANQMAASQQGSPFINKAQTDISYICTYDINIKTDTNLTSRRAYCPKAPKSEGVKSQRTKANPRAYDISFLIPLLESCYLQTQVTAAWTGTANVPEVSSELPHKAAIGKDTVKRRKQMLERSEYELSIPDGTLTFQSSVASSKEGHSGPKAKLHSLRRECVLSQPLNQSLQMLKGQVNGRRLLKVKDNKEGQGHKSYDSIRYLKENICFQGFVVETANPLLNKPLAVLKTIETYIIIVINREMQEANIKKKVLQPPTTYTVTVKAGQDYNYHLANRETKMKRQGSDHPAYCDNSVRTKELKETRNAQTTDYDQRTLSTGDDDLTRS
ncbi:hypothetical protein Celaphus_00017935, partial [Cervus elaphus hippelaphus]